MADLLSFILKPEKLWPKEEEKQESATASDFSPSFEAALGEKQPASSLLVKTRGEK